jgi:chemotaxis regulatin CheY-phosphate phosphatase CheZ
MSNDPFALVSPPLASSPDAEYESIFAAVMETARGRWFLTEYARRNHPTDTESGLAAIRRMEAAIGGDRAMRSFERFRLDVVDMAEAIARTKAEIAAIKPDAERHGKIEDAAEPLESIVQITKTAAARILAAAERMQEVSWALREQGIDAEFCGQLDAQATEIYTACSLQDLTGPHTRKMIDVVDYLEDRINSIIDIWSRDVSTASEQKAFEAALTDDPSPPSAGHEQADVSAQESSGASAEERQDASIEDIGRFMMALEPLVASNIHENDEASQKTPANDGLQIDLAPLEISMAEKPQQPLTPATASAENSAVELASAAAMQPAVAPEPAAKPAAPSASIFDRIQAAALLLLPRSQPAPLAARPAVTEPPPVDPPVLDLMPAMELASNAALAAAPAEMTTPSVAAGQADAETSPEPAAPLAELPTSMPPPSSAAAAIVAENPPEWAAPLAERAEPTLLPNVAAEDAIVENLPEAPAPSAELVERTPPSVAVEEAAVVENPPEAVAPAVALAESMPPLSPAIEEPAAEIPQSPPKAPAAEPESAIIALEAAPEAPASSPEAWDAAAPMPAAPAEEPAPAIAALEPEADDFLFGPAPSSPDLTKINSKDTPAPSTVSEDHDPADFLLEPAPTHVPVASFENLLAVTLELPTAEATPVSPPAEPLAAARLQGAALADTAPAPTRAIPGPASAFPSRPAAKPVARTPNDPLATLRALSNEEKIALFS